MDKQKNKKLQKQLLMGLVGIGAAVASYYIYKRLTWTEYALPGPNPSSKELGNFGDMSSAGSLHEYLQELTNKYGSIGAFWWGQIRVGYITSQRILFDADNKKVLHLADRPPFLFHGFKPLITKYSIQYVNGPEFQAKYHKVYLAAYQHDMATKIPIMTKLVQQIVNKWTNSIDDDDDDEKKECIVDMGLEGFEFASKSVIYASFGSNIDDKVREDIVEGYESGWNEMEKRLIDGIPSDAARDEKFENDLNKVRNGVISIMKQSKNKDDKSFLNRLLSEKTLYDTEEKILGEAITAVVGGSHTTGYGITWIFNYIARDAMIQQKMFDEIKHHFDINSNIGDMDANIIYDKIKRLIYCKQVITETLRLSSLAPWAARVNYNDDIILNKCDGKGGKIKIPKGMAFIIGQGVALNDGNVFHDPYKFDPDRWSRINVKHNKILHQSQNAMFGGLGDRMCPGWTFFRTEALIFVIGVISKFKFEIVNHIPVQTKYGLVASPKQDIYIKVSKR